MNSAQRCRVGELRPSQALFTFGIGSLIDMPNFSVLVMGLDDWDETRCQVITEERLLSIVRLRIGAQVQKLILPPLAPEEPFGMPAGAPLVGIPVTTFPRWLRCPRCDLLCHVDSGLFQMQSNPVSPDKTRYIHANCNKGPRPFVIPVRFVVACKKGHLADFPWDFFVHRGSKCQNSTSTPPLRLREFGVSGDASDIEVRCDACNAKRRMADAFGRAGSASIGACQSHHPHIRKADKDPCIETPRTILLGASNSWFPIVVSALSIPSSADKLTQLVTNSWAVLNQAVSKDFITAFRVTNQLAGFEDFSDDQIWEEVQEKKNAAPGTTAEDQIDLKLPEWQVLTSEIQQGTSDEFNAQIVAPPSGFEKVIKKVVLIEKLREVRALIGFTRVESPGDFYDSMEAPEQGITPLSRTAPKIIPASDVRGEGIFIEFNESYLQEWTSQKDVQEKEIAFFNAHKSWRTMRKIKQPELNFPGIRYVFLHSFSHALMRQLALECGYGAASIRERIYSRNADDPRGAMAGVLLYTAATDSEGTLGGLVSLGSPMELSRHLDQALESMKLCSSDPLCSEHMPFSDGLTLNASACHACLYAPETSCERGNKYLDRTVLVPTFSAETLAFFK